MSQHGLYDSRRKPCRPGQDRHGRAAPTAPVQLGEHSHAVGLAVVSSMVGLDVGGRERCQTSHNDRVRMQHPEDAACGFPKPLKVVRQAGVR